MSNVVITIARGFGSGGRTIGKMLAKKLDVNYYDSELIRLASEESGINIELFGKADERVKVNLFKRYKRSWGEWVIPPDSDKFVSDDNLFNYQAKIIRDLADKQSCVIIGRCADYILRENENAIKIFIYADEEYCTKNVCELYGLSESDARRRIESIDRARAAYCKYYTGLEWNSCENYDLCLNTSKLSFEKATDIVADYVLKICDNK